MCIGLSQEAADGGLEIGDACEDAAFEPPSCQLGEEAPDRDAIRPLKRIPQARCGGAFRSWEPQRVQWRGSGSSRLGSGVALCNGAS